MLCDPAVWCCTISGPGRRFQWLTPGGDSMLYVNGHFDPEGNMGAKEECCRAIGALVSRISPQGVVFSGDLNTHKTGTSVITRLLRPVQCLAALHLNYPLGQATNVTWAGGTTKVTEIHYLVVSKNLRVAQLDLYPGVCTHRVLVANITGFTGAHAAADVKRYKHRAATAEQVHEVAALLTLYWWWLKHHVCHLDASVHVHWFLADPVLQPSSLRVSAASVMCRGRSLAAASSDGETLRAWHQSVRDLLFQRGLRLNSSNILSSVCITSHTTKDRHVQQALPKPYPEILQGAKDMVAPAESLQEAAEQLDFYHVDCSMVCA